MNKTGFGFSRLPLTDADDNKAIDTAQVCRLVDEYIEAGGVYFDTAYTYHGGCSETAIRECLVKRYPRDSFILSDKLPTSKLRSREDCQKYFDEMTERCGVDYFDVFMVHWLNAEYYEKAKEYGSFEFVKDLKDRGIARRIGFSCHDTADMLDRILTDHPEIDIVLMQINYLDWESPFIQSRLCYETALKHGKDIWVMEPVKGGTLAQLPEEAEAIFRAIRPDDEPARWALRFVQSLPGVKLCLSGMNTSSQIRQNISDMDPMTEEELAACRKVAEVLSSGTAIPCTACNYCIDSCTKNIPIPEYFRMYNEYSRCPKEDWKINPVYMQMAQRGFGKASDCISCGRCEKMCPQKIEIRRWLGEVKDALEW